MSRSLSMVAVVSFFLSVIALCTFEILSVDFGWHLKSGELIWETKSIPNSDVFSYIAEGRPWVDSHWLFQLVFFGIHAAAGIPGLYVLRVALLVATFAFLLSANQRRQYLPVSLFICLLALFTSYQRFVMRPELASPYSAKVAFPLDPVAIYKLFVGVSALSWIGHWRRVRFAHILIYAAFLYLSTLATRNMSLFAVVATPITIRNLNGLVDRACANAKFVMRRAVAASTAAAMIFVAAGTGRLLSVTNSTSGWAGREPSALACRTDSLVTSSRNWRRWMGDSSTVPISGGT